MQGALGLPDSIAALDVDRQLDIYKAKARAVFGSDAVAQLASGKTMDKMTRNYLIRDQIENGTTVANSRHYKFCRPAARPAEPASCPCCSSPHDRAAS